MTMNSISGRMGHFTAELHQELDHLARGRGAQAVGQQHIGESGLQAMIRDPNVSTSEKMDGFRQLVMQQPQFNNDQRQMLTRLIRDMATSGNISPQDAAQLGDVLFTIDKKHVADNFSPAALNSIIQDDMSARMALQNPRMAGVPQETIQTSGWNRADLGSLARQAGFRQGDFQLPPANARQQAPQPSSSFAPPVQQHEHQAYVPSQHQQHTSAQLPPLRDDPAHYNADPESFYRNAPAPQPTPSHVPVSGQPQGETFSPMEIIRRQHAGHARQQNRTERVEENFYNKAREGLHAIWQPHSSNAMSVLHKAMQMAPDTPLDQKHPGLMAKRASLDDVSYRSKLVMDALDHPRAGHVLNRVPEFLAVVTELPASQQPPVLRKLMGMMERAGHFRGMHEVDAHVRNLPKEQQLTSFSGYPKTPLAYTGNGLEMGEVEQHFLATLQKVTSQENKPKLPPRRMNIQHESGPGNGFVPPRQTTPTPPASTAPVQQQEEEYSNTNPPPVPPKPSHHNPDDFVSSSRTQSPLQQTTEQVYQSPTVEDEVPTETELPPVPKKPDSHYQSPLQSPQQEFPRQQSPLQREPARAETPVSPRTSTPISGAELRRGATPPAPQASPANVQRETSSAATLSRPLTPSTHTNRLGSSAYTAPLSSQTPMAENITERPLPSPSPVSTMAAPSPVAGQQSAFAPPSAQPFSQPVSAPVSPTISHAESESLEEVEPIDLSAVAPLSTVETPEVGQTAQPPGTMTFSETEHPEVAIDLPDLRQQTPVSTPAPAEISSQSRAQTPAATASSSKATTPTETAPTETTPPPRPLSPFSQAEQEISEGLERMPTIASEHVAPFLSLIGRTALDRLPPERQEKFLNACLGEAMKLPELARAMVITSFASHTRDPELRSMFFLQGERELQALQQECGPLDAEHEVDEPTLLNLLSQRELMTAMAHEVASLNAEAKEQDSPAYKKALDNLINTAVEFPTWLHTPELTDGLIQAFNAGKDHDLETFQSLLLCIASTEATPKDHGYKGYHMPQFKPRVADDGLLMDAVGSSYEMLTDMPDGTPVEGLLKYLGHPFALMQGLQHPNSFAQSFSQSLGLLQAMEPGMLQEDHHYALMLSALNDAQQALTQRQDLDAPTRAEFSQQLAELRDAFIPESQQHNSGFRTHLQDAVFELGGFNGESAR
ncbi:hypothetical protein ACKC9G_15155 [Pokkaliibacter sp. CJK22405]|uniref:hypothetical protein n=1 Tax=Pokkaliibacter sp. CJK22405 TaxID=3384615 RepID=UPI003984CD3C